MARSKGDGARALRRKSFGTFRPLTAAEWKHIEDDLLDGRLSEQARERIDAANGAFAVVAPSHSHQDSIPIKEISKQIRGWQKTTRSLRGELETPHISKIKNQTRAKIIAAYASEKAIKRIGKMPPLQFLAFTIRSALAAANLALHEIEQTQGLSSLKGDLWFAWVCIIASILRSEGFKVSASSSNKTSKNSPFVLLIEKLQDTLPKECKRFTGYDSIAKGVQKAKREFGSYKESTLLAILTGFGSHILKNYSPELLAQFAAAPEVTPELLKSKTKKKRPAKE